MRPLLAVCLALACVEFSIASEPKPIWEVDISGGNRLTGPGWLSYSPDGQSIAAVIVREVGSNPPEYRYQLRVWNASNQKERFNAELGTARTAHWGDELASFPSDDTILTGGQHLTVRNLENGQTTSTQETGAMSDFAVWSVPDLKESFYLRRDTVRLGLPVELFFQSSAISRDEFVGFRRPRFNGLTTEQTSIQPPRSGLQTENIAMNFGRTHLAVAFRDETPTSKPRHTLVMLEIKTVEEFGLTAVAEAENPHPGPISAMAFARNGKTFATGGEDGSVALWDADFYGSSWKPRVLVQGVSDHRVYAIAFSRNWSILAAATWDKTKPNLLLMDGYTGKVLNAVRLERELSAVSFSPDGRTLLTGSANGKLRAWDVATLLKTN
jgi:WD40 repeat protein